MNQVNNLEIDVAAWINKATSHGYSFAAWRLPNQEDKTLIIDLGDPRKLDTSFKHADTGFLVNKFSDHHPTQPLLIKSDISINLSSSEMQIDPRINDKQLDELKETLKASGKQASKLGFQASPKGNAYEQLVGLAVKEIRNKKYSKVVLARCKEVDLPVSFNPLDFFNRVCEQYSSAFCSLFYLPNEGLWIGASPEVLIDSNERYFKTVSVAGTKKVDDGSPLGDTSWTQKEIEEQALVSRYIINCFKKLRLREFDEYGPKTVKAGNLLHLKTEFSVDLSKVAYDGLGDQMMELLHPTSAVCGMPLQEAKAFLDQHEGFDRSFYSGFLGPVNHDGQTNLFVNLRCMNIRGGQARLFAGAGITEDSDPKKEFLETEMKMDTLAHLIY